VVNEIDDLLSEYVKIDKQESIWYYTRDGQYLKKIFFKPSSSWIDGGITGVYREYYFLKNQLIFMASYTDLSDIEQDLLRFYFKDRSIIRYSEAGKGIHDYDPPRDPEEYFSIFIEKSVYYYDVYEALKLSRTLG